MPPTYTPRPYVRQPYAADTRQLGNIYARQGEVLAESQRQRGATSSQFLAGLAAAFQQIQAQEAAKAEQAQMLAMRQQEKDDANAIRREEMTLRADERKAAAAERRTANDEQAAIYAAENTSPGPLDRFTAQVIRKFPGTAARLKMRETLPASVTPGAMGAVEQEPSQFDVLQMTPQQERQAQLDTAARAREAQTALDREADNTRQSARDAESKRHNQALERAANARPQTAEPLEAVIGPDGLPTLVPRSQARGMRPATSREQPTEDERKSAGFFKQMNEAMATMDAVEDQLTERDLYQIQSVPQEELIGLINRGEMSEAAKRYLRAFEQFTEARMRPVSGAAISDSEFARDRRTYARQYGETPTLAQERKAARSSARDSLRTRGGRAIPKDEAKPKDNDPLGIRK